MMEARLAKVRQRKLKQNPEAPGENAEEPRYVLGMKLRKYCIPIKISPVHCIWQLTSLYLAHMEIVVLYFI